MSFEVQKVQFVAKRLFILLVADYFYLPITFSRYLIWISLPGKVCSPGFGITEIRHDCEEDVDEDEGHLDVVAGAGLREELLLPQQELGDGDQDGQQGRDGCQHEFD